MEMKTGHLFMLGKNSHGQLGLEISDKEIIYDNENFTSNLLLLKDYKNVTVVSCGPSHSGFINQGKIYMFGDGSFGKLGNGSTEDKKSPTVIAYESTYEFKDLVSANEHTLALGSDNRMFSWGSTTYGRLGTGVLTYKVRVTPMAITEIPRAKSIYACGASSACLTDEGELYTWGINKNGQLGHGDYKDRSLPTKVSYFGGIRIVKVSMGNRQMGCIDANGNLFMWGLNDSYQLGDGSSFTKPSPTMINNKGQRFRDLICGGDFTAAITGDEDKNSLYVWGGFVREYASNKPRKIAENVKSAACSIDCGKHLIYLTMNGETHTVGWSRYGQAARECDTAMVENSLMKPIVGRTSSFSCGAYHSSFLFNGIEDYLAMLISLNLSDQLFEDFPKYSARFDFQNYRNYENNNILHLLAKSEIAHTPQLFDQFHSLINTNNASSLPAFFYHPKMLQWYHKKVTKANLRYQIPISLDTCLHHYARQNNIEFLDLAMRYGGLETIFMRNRENKRALELLDDQVSYEFKLKHAIYNIGIVGDSECVSISELLIESFGREGITACRINESNSKSQQCIGYIFCITAATLSSSFYKDFLLNFVSKQPMVSIWVKKSNISDPVMESCIYRSQLVDFSSESLYSNSLSVIVQGAHNMISYVPRSNEDEEDKEMEIKTDVEYTTSRSENQSIFLSYDPSKLSKFQPLIDFLRSHGIEVISREKGVLMSWLVVAIISTTDLSPLMRDEISLAENRNKLVIPIYHQGFVPLDKGLTYSFANAPKILFSEEGFHQLLLSIKLQFKLLEESNKLFNLKKIK